MNANAGWLYDLQDVRGYDSMIPKQYVEYMQQIYWRIPLPTTNRIAPLKPDNLAALDSRYLDALSVKYVVSLNLPSIPPRIPSTNRSIRIKAAYIYENSQAFPRAYLQPPSVDVTDQSKAPLPTNAATFTEKKVELN